MKSTPTDHSLGVVCRRGFRLGAPKELDIRKYYQPETRRESAEAEAAFEHAANR